MRNRNNKYFSPSSFEQILNNGEIEELKEWLLFLTKCPLGTKYYSCFTSSNSGERKCMYASCSYVCPASYSCCNWTDLIFKIVNQQLRESCITNGLHA